MTDVIGQVMDFGGVDIVNHARKEVTKMVFTLRDGRYVFLIVLIYLYNYKI